MVFILCVCDIESLSSSSGNWGDILVNALDLANWGQIKIKIVLPCGCNPAPLMLRVQVFSCWNRDGGGVVISWYPCKSIETKGSCVVNKNTMQDSIISLKVKLQVYFWVALMVLVKIQPRHLH